MAGRIPPRRRRRSPRMQRATQTSAVLSATAVAAVAVTGRNVDAFAVAPTLPPVTTRRGGSLSVRVRRDGPTSPLGSLGWDIGSDTDAAALRSVACRPPLAVSSSGRTNGVRRAGGGGATQLRLFNRNQDNDSDNDKKDKKNDQVGEEDKEKSDDDDNKLIQSVKVKLTALLPPAALAQLEKTSDFVVQLLPKLRLAFASFTFGILFAAFGILYPVYTSLEHTSEPVMLFETILSDLDRGYVDKVDTNKLFETGISAMLRSLDPYTEFEGRTEAAELTESVQGKYGGVGLVISGPVPSDAVLLKGVKDGVMGGGPGRAGAGEGQDGQASKLLPQDAIDDANAPSGDATDPIAASSPSGQSTVDDELIDDPDDDEETLQTKAEQRRAIIRARKQGVRVVQAFEGYAYDYGMRVGDKLVAVDGNRIEDGGTVEQVRNRLRGEPGTFVDVTFEREGLDGESTISIPRTVVQISDVKLASLLGNKEDGIGYVQLSGFSANAGREMRNAIIGLQRLAEDNAGPGGTAKGLRGLVLDLRGNPGGLLTSAVDVASLLVPEGSDIVSAKGRGFPGILYRSRVDPILAPETKLVVLVNKQTASAAEIVSGAVQDLDVGVIVGYDRTFGKGLVQNVEELPFDTALKYTVAKYYTPSGRCIQSTNYKEGGGLNVEDGKYRARTVADGDKTTYFTKNGREVKDGGGVAVDYKIDAAKASALEFTLLRSGVYSDFAALWSRDHQLTNNLDVVDDGTYKKFQAFVMQKQKEGDIKLEAIYSAPIESLKKSLKTSGYKGTTKELEQLQANLIREIEKDFEKYKDGIKEDVNQNILARYLPESMLLDRGARKDKQVTAAVDLLKDEKQFNKLLGRTGISGGGVKGGLATEGASTAIASEKGASEDYRVMFR